MPSARAALALGVDLGELQRHPVLGALRGEREHAALDRGHALGAAPLLAEVEREAHPLADRERLGGEDARAVASQLQRGGRALLARRALGVQAHARGRHLDAQAHEAPALGALHRLAALQPHLRALARSDLEHAGGEEAQPLLVAVAHPHLVAGVEQGVAGRQRGLEHAVGVLRDDALEDGPLAPGVQVLQRQGLLELGLFGHGRSRCRSRRASAG